MEKSEFRKPLTQSAAIVAVVIVLFALISSSSAAGTGGGILALFSGIGNLILFLIGLSIALPFSIAVVIGIFLGAVALYSKETSVRMYSDLKKNFSDNIVTLKDKWTCCSSGSNDRNSGKKTDLIQQGIAQLEEHNVKLHNKIEGLKSHSSNLNAELNDLKKINLNLDKQVTELHQLVEKLQSSNQELVDQISALNGKVEKAEEADGLQIKLSALELTQKESEKTIAALANRLESMEASAKQSPPAGIFSYIESENDQAFFATTAEEAVAKEMTYSQIDEYFSEKLSPDLDKIIKDHPSLTKTYIRNLKRE